MQSTVRLRSKVTNLQRWSLWLCVLVLIIKVQRIVGAIWKSYINILKCVVHSVMALKFQESSGRSHRANWCHKSYSFAGVIQSAGSIRMNCQIYNLHHNCITRFFWVWNWKEISAGTDKIGLSWRAGVLAPKSFHIDTTNVTATTLTSENAIDLFIRSNLWPIIVFITAAHFAIILNTLS